MHLFCAYATFMKEAPGHVVTELTSLLRSQMKSGTIFPPRKSQALSLTWCSHKQQCQKIPENISLSENICAHIAVILGGSWTRKRTQFPDGACPSVLDFINNTLASGQLCKCYINVQLCKSLQVFPLNK